MAYERSYYGLRQSDQETSNTAQSAQPAFPPHRSLHNAFADPGFLSLPRA
jgi:hypothetical protein